MQMRCERLDQDIDPLAVGIATGQLWSRSGLVIGGVGEAARLVVDRPDGGAAAQQQLVGMAGADEMERPASGVVALGALPFDPSLPGELVVPRVAVVRDAQRRRWLIVDDELSTTDALALIDDALAPTAMPQATNWHVESPVAPEAWRDEVVAVVRDRIAAGEFRKVVLARELLVTADQPIDTAAVLRRLYQSFATAAVFAIDGFLGASPELLVGRVDDVVHAHPLAGTAPRSADPAEDGRLSAGLAASAKNRIEHGITIDWLLDNLLPYCSYVDAEPEPSIVTLANLHHLGTRVEGRLSAPAASILDLVGALHPTPALGGDPQGGALEVIETVEPGERGRYGGPVGWVDASGNGEFAVGIRSGTFDGATASVWAGVGVVGDSDPEAELAETRTKFQAMFGALLRP